MRLFDVYKDKKVNFVLKYFPSPRESNTSIVKIPPRPSPSLF
jgi:hypothetical protein